MALKKNISEESKVDTQVCYTKQALLKCNEFKKDLVSALLKDDRKYTKAEAKKIIDEFMKGGVC